MVMEGYKLMFDKKLVEKAGSDEKTKKRVDAWKDLLNKRKAVAAVSLKRALSRVLELLGC